MISLPVGTQVWLAAGITDMRRGMYGLAALVETTLAGSPYSGHVFVFRGRRGDLLKVLWADRDGLCLFVKRLECTTLQHCRAGSKISSNASSARTFTSRLSRPR